MYPQKPSIDIKFYQIKSSSIQQKSEQHNISQQKFSKFQGKSSQDDLISISQKQFYLLDSKRSNLSRKCRLYAFQQDPNIKSKGFDKQKVKRIQKSRNSNKDNNQSHKSGGSIASIFNKKLIQIIEQQLGTLNIPIDFSKNYIDRFNLHGQKQNILIVPFLVLDCLVTKSNSNSWKNQGTENQTYYITQKSEWFQTIYNTFQRIFINLACFLKESYEKKALKKGNKGHQTQKHSFQVYLQIIEYLKSHFHSIINQRHIKNHLLNQGNSMIFGRNDSQHYLFGSQIIRNSQNFCEKSVSNSHQVNFFGQRMMEEEQQDKSEEQFDKLFDKLFKVKQRDIEKAKDKFKSIQLSTKLMRTIFGIKWDHKVPIKQFLDRSIDQKQKRQYGLKKKNNHYYKERFYECMKSKKEQYTGKVKIQENFETLVDKLNIASLGEDFLMALMCISLLRRKNVHILGEFIELINRRIKYMDETQEIVFMYNKRTYQYFLQLLSRPINKNLVKKQHLDCNNKNETEKESKYSEDEQSSAQYSIQEWVWNEKEKGTGNQEKNQRQYQKGLQSECLDSIRAIVRGYEQIRQQFREEDLSMEGIKLKFNM